MNFPEFWNSIKWRVIGRGEDLWLALSTGEEKRIGTKTVYQRINNLREKVLEINLYNRGTIAHIWFPDAVDSPRLVYARILKDGNWVYGSKGEPLCLEALWVKSVDGRRKFWGVRLKLKVSEAQFVAVDVIRKS